MTKSIFIAVAMGLAFFAYGYIFSTVGHDHSSHSHNMNNQEESGQPHDHADHDHH